MKKVLSEQQVNVGEISIRDTVYTNGIGNNLPIALDGEEARMEMDDEGTFDGLEPLNFPLVRLELLDFHFYLLLFTGHRHPLLSSFFHGDFPLV